MTGHGTFHAPHRCHRLTGLTSRPGRRRFVHTRSGVFSYSRWVERAWAVALWLDRESAPRLGYSAPRLGYSFRVVRAAGARDTQPSFISGTLPIRNDSTRRRDVDSGSSRGAMTPPNQPWHHTPVAPSHDRSPPAGIANRSSELVPCSRWQRVRRALVACAFAGAAVLGGCDRLFEAECEGRELDRCHSGCTRVMRYHNRKKTVCVAACRLDRDCPRRTTARQARKGCRTATSPGSRARASRTVGRARTTFPRSSPRRPMPLIPLDEIPAIPPRQLAYRG